MNRTLDVVATRALSLPLKSAGFRKRGRTWRRHTGRDGAIQVVNLQGSMFSTRDEGRCALNLGIYFPALADVLGVGSVTQSPTEADCHLRRRAAMLGPDRRDTWFDFRAGDPESLDAAAASIRGLFIEFGERWLDQFSTLASARDELARTGYTWWAAAASLCAGDREEAARFTREAIEHSPKDPRAHLVAWGRRHGLV